MSSVLFCIKGDRCEVALNNCSLSPCQNNASCTPITNTTYKCNCVGRYTGQNCQTYQPFCPERPCRNNATCRDFQETQSYNCTCPPGFTGANCETDINHCLQNNCSSNGTCVDGVTGYTCVCLPGTKII